MPDHWQETTLGEALSECQNGLQYKNDPSAGGLPISRIQTISGGRINLEKVGFAGLSEANESRYMLEAGDILFSHINSAEHVGNSVLVEDRHLPLIHGMNLLRLRSSAICLSAFLFLVIASPEFRSEVRRRSKKAVNQVSINQTALRELPITLPPLTEQRRIVDLVGSIDAYIDALEAQIDATRTAREGMLSELLLNPADNWQETTLSEVANIVSERLDPTMIKETAYVGLEHLVTDQRKLLSWGSTVDVSSSITPFRSGDTLFGRLRPYLRKGCVAEFDGVCSPEILVIRTKGSVDERFIGLLILNSQTFEECVRLSAGTRMPRTSARDLKALSVLIPPLDEQRRIVDLVGSIDANIDALEAQIDATRTARAGLLSELLSGDRLLTDDYDVAEGL